MSLFINNLAFDAPILQDETKIGVLAGSVLSALAGWLVFSLARQPASAHIGR
jgi:NhaA family Na+:H+ antiporter